MSFSAALCRGLIEAGPVCGLPGETYPFSAALCRGLIEARRSPAARPAVPARFPRLYAAASLKQRHAGDVLAYLAGFSAALCRGLIEAIRCFDRCRTCLRCFPRLYAAASLKLWHVELSAISSRSFPRLYAAASLKRSSLDACGPPRGPFSAALCRGLIEADARVGRVPPVRAVFRGFMPRPH